jgi:hypothetical protein
MIEAWLVVFLLVASTQEMSTEVLSWAASLFRKSSKALFSMFFLGVLRPDVCRVLKTLLNSTV